MPFAVNISHSTPPPMKDKINYSPHETGLIFGKYSFIAANLYNMASESLTDQLESLDISTEEHLIF